MTVSASPRLFGDFPATFRGSVLRPGADGYDGARTVFQGKAFDSNPALIAQCVDAADVATAVRYASDAGIPIAVRGGGHGSDGYAMPDAALVVDLSRMKTVTVDREAASVHAEAGVLLGELDAATCEFGLAVPSGTVSTTGIAGLTLGGGIGHLMRRYGATVDHLVACDLITADGAAVRASPEENPELFWALRGGGGNFGVVTAFYYRARPIEPQVLAGQIFFDLAQAPRVLAGLARFMAGAPRELGVLAAVAPAPPLPALAESAHGQPALVLVPVLSGTLPNAAEIIDSLAALGSPLANTVTALTWPQANSMLDASAPYGQRMNSRGGYLTSLSSDEIAAALDIAAAAPGESSGVCSVNLWCLGGAISEDVAEDAMAFSRRGATWLCEVVSVWSAPDDDHIYDHWASEARSALEPLLLTNCYTNLSDDLGESWRRQAHGAEDKHQRLRQVKRDWDPDNLFRYNKNIAPSDLSHDHLAQISDVQDYNTSVIDEFRRLGGSVGGDLAGQTALLLTTIGAKTGQLRTTPLLYVEFDGRRYILGSFRGAPRHPSWVFNLRANPAASVEIGTDTQNVEAIELEADERSRVFDRIVAQQPLFAELRDATTRVIPIFELRSR